ncbi:hypothetical protein BM613_06650 [Sulfoacidibacillus thermotolerans]|uniref:Glycosyltransferase 2-like domain-containing protein n=2 Tax=Sulfoacidibacillus thermotolerans TaxID=1765684 RepID=A0A2U3D9C6_SULT2|nr:hypothetical protein BM613_06650 [Sulfoacidibacillus thermotolerans]
MLTSIIIPTLNHWEYTKQCLESIRKFTNTPYEIIVVDNGSNDETVASLRAMNDVLLVENEGNRGFPAACNQGMAVAHGDQLLILNNDVIVSYRWLDNLLHCLYADCRHGAVGPVSNAVSGIQFRPQPYQTIEEYHNFTQDHNHSNPEQWITTLRLVGFCLLIRRDIYNEIGSFDERFGKGTYEDDDYSLRIRRAGYKLIVAADTYVHHFGSVTNRIDPEYRNVLVTNQQKFIEKWGVDPFYSLWLREDLAALVPKVDRVLDVGCACGGLGLTLKNKGISYVAGIELDKNAAIDAQSVLDQVWIGDAGKIQLPFPNQWFDAMVFADVIEHVAQPQHMLKNLLPYLKENGYLIVSIPNVGHLEILHGLLQGTWTYQNAGILDRTHLRFYTLEEIARLFEQVGVAIEFIGMVQDSTPELEALLRELEALTVRLSLKSFGPPFIERCRTVQYYLRARKLSQGASL